MYRLYETETGDRPQVIKVGRLELVNAFYSPEGAQIVAERLDPTCEKYGVEVAP